MGNWQASLQHNINGDIFKSTGTCHAGSTPDECPCIGRLVAALQYYTKLNTKTSKEGLDIFADFIKEMYGHYLDDIVHLTDVHEEHLKEINQSLFTKYGLKECVLTQCNLTNRHCQTKTEKHDHLPTEPVHSFYRVLFDSVHFYLFHLFSLGLRSLKDDDEDEHEDEAEHSHLTKNFDAVFRRKQKSMEMKQKHFGVFLKRLKMENNKFLIKTQAKRKRDGMSLHFVSFIIDSFFVLRIDIFGWTVGENAVFFGV